MDDTIRAIVNSRPELFTRWYQTLQVVHHKALLLQLCWWVAVLKATFIEYALFLLASGSRRRTLDWPKGDDVLYFFLLVLLLPVMYLTRLRDITSYILLGTIFCPHWAYSWQLPIVIDWEALSFLSFKLNISLPPSLEILIIRTVKTGLPIIGIVISITISGGGKQLRRPFHAAVWMPDLWNVLAMRHFTADLINRSTLLFVPHFPLRSASPKSRTTFSSTGARIFAF